MLGGIILGIIIASLASDEISLIQAQTPAQKDLARFYIGIISVISSVVLLLTTVGTFESKSVLINFIRVTAATVTIVNVTFLSIVPQLLVRLKS